MLGRLNAGKDAQGRLCLFFLPVLSPYMSIIAHLPYACQVNIKKYLDSLDSFRVSPRRMASTRRVGIQCIQDTYRSNTCDSTAEDQIVITSSLTSPYPLTFIPFSLIPHSSLIITSPHHLITLTSQHHSLSSHPSLPLTHLSLTHRLITHHHRHHSPSSSSSSSSSSPLPHSSPHLSLTSPHHISLTSSPHSLSLSHPSSPHHLITSLSSPLSHLIASCPSSL